MREESQLEDMRAALRGERERARQGAARVPEPLAPQVVQEPASEPEPPARRGLRSLFRRR